MKQGMKRARKTCPRCGKDVAVQYSGRSAAPGEPVAHKCPHGCECIETTTTVEGLCLYVPLCDKCEPSTEKSK